MTIASCTGQATFFSRGRRNEPWTTGLLLHLDRTDCPIQTNQFPRSTRRATEVFSSTLRAGLGAHCWSPPVGGQVTHVSASTCGASLSAYGTYVDGTYFAQQLAHSGVGPAQREPIVAGRGQPQPVVALSSTTVAPSPNIIPLRLRPHP